MASPGSMLNAQVWDTSAVRSGSPWASTAMGPMDFGAHRNSPSEYRWSALSVAGIQVRSISVETSSARSRSPDSSRDTSFARSEEHTSELQSRGHLVWRLLLEKNK